MKALIVVLPVFWALGQLRTWWNPPLDAVVFAVVVAVGLPRSIASLAPRELLRAGAALLLGAASAVGCGVLLGRDTWSLALGATLFALGVSLPIWMRRFGAGWRAIGAVWALPFLAVLIHPQPDPASWNFFGWMVLAATIAFVWSAIVHLLTGPTLASPAALLTRSNTRRLASSTRMAIQLAIAVGGAFAFGQWFDPAHLVWPVMTTLIVHSANRGRGDVLVKGSERAGGAVAGTLIATAFVGKIDAGDNASLVIVFAALILAAGLNEVGYVFRAACTTAALAFFYGYFGQSGSALLGDRLIGVAGGALLGIASAWFVLPVRTTDVTRSRIAALLTTSAKVAAQCATGSVDPLTLDRLATNGRDVGALTHTLHFARVFGIGPARQLERAVGGAVQLAKETQAQVDRGKNGTVAFDEGIAELQRRIAAARRALRA